MSTMPTVLPINERDAQRAQVLIRENGYLHNADNDPHINAPQSLQTRYRFVYLVRDTTTNAIFPTPSHQPYSHKTSPARIKKVLRFKDPISKHTARAFAHWHSKNMQRHNLPRDVPHVAIIDNKQGKIVAEWSAN